MPQANKLELQGGAAAKPEGEDGNDSGTKSQSCLGRYGSAAKISRLLGNSQFAQAQVSVPLHGAQARFARAFWRHISFHVNWLSGRLARANLGPAMVDCHS